MASQQPPTSANPHSDAYIVRMHNHLHEFYSPAELEQILMDYAKKDQVRKASRVPSQKVLERIRQKK
jgi:hypothetical protein